tara:strand:- start:280 stop:738 length:459 start_codon:yes stop_codon:yes gene_type:complete
MESLLPEWAPNIHPLIIHFPIAIWFIAVLFDLLFLCFSKDWLRNATVLLYFAATLSAIAAYYSGEDAMDRVLVPMQGEVSASNHSDWGSYTFYFFGVYVLLRIFFYWKKWDKLKWFSIFLFILGVVGAGIVTKTADLGGKLVYKYGIGINKQ